MPTASTTSGAACSRLRRSPEKVTSEAVSRIWRVRTLNRARIHWQAGRPHEAWEILADAGLAEAWPEFLRVALRTAGERYRREIRAVIIR